MLNFNFSHSGNVFLLASHDAQLVICMHDTVNTYMIIQTLAAESGASGVGRMIIRVRNIFVIFAIGALALR